MGRKNHAGLDDVYAEINRLALGKNYLVHARSILARRDKKDRLDTLDRIASAYLSYLSANQATGFDDDTVKMRVDALNHYYDFLHDEGLDNVYSAQTKLRPTILEEFLAILFRDLLDGFCAGKPADILGLGSVKAYANLYFHGRDFAAFAAKPTIGLNVVSAEKKGHPTWKT